jgi:hypothetical protein
VLKRPYIDEEATFLEAGEGVRCPGVPGITRPQAPIAALFALTGEASYVALLRMCLTICQLEARTCAVVAARRVRCEAGLRHGVLHARQAASFPLRGR